MHLSYAEKFAYSESLWFSFLKQNNLKLMIMIYIKSTIWFMYVVWFIDCYNEILQYF